MQQDAIARRGLMLVLSSPSGAGKTTLAKMLLTHDKQTTMSISMTTRPPRPGEIDGVDYKFATNDEFKTAIENGDLLEWAEVFGNLYGTPMQAVTDELKGGRDVLFDIDWQGTQQLHEKAGKDVVRVFILPPDGETLATRLKNRGQDDAKTVAKRMQDAANQISHWAEYDYVIINQDIEICLNEVQTILAAERLKRERRTGLSSLIRAMTSKM